MAKHNDDRAPGIHLLRVRRAAGWAPFDWRPTAAGAAELAAQLRRQGLEVRVDPVPARTRERAAP